MTQKGSKLTGAAVTEEVLASSESVIKPAGFMGAKGLQQFFTPPQAAKLVADVIGSHVTVFDPTAGSGQLLSKFDKPYSFGVEIDQDQIDASEGSYNKVQGDIQHIYPLLRRAVSFGAVCLNPPFGLTWEEPSYNDGKDANSTAIALYYANNLVDEDGQIVLIAGRDRFYREIAGLDEAKGFYCVIECEDLFEGIQLPCVIAFGFHSRRTLTPREDGERYATKKVPLDMLDLLPNWVTEAREEAVGGYFRSRPNYDNHKIPEAFHTIEIEYQRRTGERLESKKKRSFDVELVGGKILNIVPSPYAQLVLAKIGKAWIVNRLNGASVNYFLNSEREWNSIVGLEESKIITIDPRAHEAINSCLAEFKRVTCPLYKIKPQQRLGYLTDIDSIKCTKTDKERGFVADEHYELDTRSQTIFENETRPHQILTGKRAGEWEDRTYETARKVLQVTVGHWKFTDSLKDQGDIQYLIDHFDLPDPGDVGSRHPEETEAMRVVIREIEEEMKPRSLAYEQKNATPEQNRFQGLREFQREDLARLLVKGRGLIAWEQGLGKTLGGLCFTEACVKLGAQDAALYVVPKDLIPQWQRESKRFFGRKLTLIKTHAEAKKIAKWIRMGGTGHYITYYEALSIVGTRKSTMLPEITVEEKVDYKKVPGTGRYKGMYKNEEGLEVEANTDGAVWSYGYVAEQFEESTKTITSRELCPDCKADRRSGWNGKFCRAQKQDGSICGYSHFEHRIKPMGAMLSVAFRKGIVTVDEATMTQGDYSARSEVIRGIRATHKLGMTGTPIKNYIPQAFWPLWWCLGNDTRQFPFNYTQKGLFEEKFAVIQWHRGKGGNKTGRKVLPEVTNLSELWRLLASSIIRRRKEETNEPLVKRTFHPVSVPLGVHQQRQCAKWLDAFPSLFCDKYPDSKVVMAGGEDLVRVMAPMLGLQQKLDYAATMPMADPDHDWTAVAVSNWTPANLKVIELAMSLAKQDRKVLIGSNLVSTSRFIAESLVEKGVNAIHVLDSSNQTQNPDKRAQTVFDFQTNDIQALCTGVQAIRLGHNLDAGSAVILHGLPWDFETLDQFIARVHRLTSTKDVDVYIIIPEGTLTDKKWQNLTLKGQAAELALDGRLIEKEEDKVDSVSVIRELMEHGIPITGEEIEEADIEEAWETWPMLNDFVISPALIAAQAGQQAGPLVLASDHKEFLDLVPIDTMFCSTPPLEGFDNG